MNVFDHHLAKAFGKKMHHHAPLTRKAWINIGFETIGPGDHYEWDGMRRGGQAHRPTWLFQYTVKGWGWLESGHRALPSPAGSAFSVKIPSRHRYHSDSACEEWTFFWIITNHPYAVERMTSTTDLYNLVFPFTEEASATLLAFRQMIETIRDEQVKDQYRNEVRLLSFVYELERYTFLSQHPMADRESLLESVNQRVLRDLTVSDLAREHGMSRTHFSHHFRKTTGETPAAYLRKKRLARAEVLLTTTSLSVKEIAAETGFTDSNQLCKSFRAHFQCSPGDYRRMAISSATTA